MNRTTPIHGSNYALSITTRVSRYQEQEYLVATIPHVTLLTYTFCLLWSEGRDILPKTYAHTDRRRKGNGWRRVKLRG